MVLIFPICQGSSQLQWNVVSCFKVSWFSLEKQKKKCFHQTTRNPIIFPFQFSLADKIVERKFPFTLSSQPTEKIAIVTDILVIPSTRVSTRNTGGPKPFPDFPSLESIGLSFVVCEKEKNQHGKHVFRREIRRINNPQFCGHVIYCLAHAFVDISPSSGKRFGELPSWNSIFSNLAIAISTAFVPSSLCP